MARVIVIGAGGVASVTVHKIVQNADVFTDLLIATRTRDKADRLRDKLQGLGVRITTAAVDADEVEQLVALFEDFGPDVVINLALPYQDLSIMEACLAYGVDYVDTANYEPLDTAKFEYSWQWAYRERFEQAGLTALLGSGFDPGVTGVFAAYAQKHHFDSIRQIDILDCNAGDHGYPFATNFNPEINIREVTAPGSYYENGAFHEVPAMSVKRSYNFPQIGTRDMYLLHHEELSRWPLTFAG